MGLLEERAASFRYAFKGIGTLVGTQRNAQIHLVATAVSGTAGFALDLTSTEWCLISVAVAGVWVADALNTATELLADAAVPERHPLVGKAKDVAAAGVLIAAMNAAVIGAVVFGGRWLS